MIEAQTKREYERREFLEAVQRYIVDEEEATHKRISFQIGICRVILKYFAFMEGLPFPPSPYSPEEKFFQKTLLPAIEKFARTPEEAQALVTDIFEWECKSIARHYKVPLQVQETT